MQDEDSKKSPDSLDAAKAEDSETVAPGTIAKGPAPDAAAGTEVTATDALETRASASSALATEGGAPAEALEDAKPEDASERDVELVEPAEPRDWKKWIPLGLAALLPLAFFFVLPPLTQSGLWDPFELNVADLARRVALNLHGASNLALEGADNSLPHLNDLGRPQLAFTSIALGFKLFGLHEWAGRAPLALWGVLGVLATYAFVSRLVDKRAGVFSAVALTTMPLYFVQARTMLGDVVTMASVAMAFGGLAVSVFDRDADGPTSAAKRAPYLVMALIGLAAGYESRGAMIGVGVPALAIGLAWGLTWAAGGRKVEAFGDAVGAGALLLGAIAVGGAANALNQEHPTDLNMWVGALIKVPSKYPTFDYIVGHLGPALAPWSAFAPFAMGRLFITPIGRRDSLLTRETHTRMAVLLGAAVALVLHGWLASKTDLIAFSAPAIIAAACGIALRDFERGAHASVAVGVATGVMLGLFHHDFHELPEKAYQAFAVNGATFPESFKDHALLLWTVALVGFAVLAFLTWVERSSTRTPFDPANYAKILNALREVWDGLLALAFFALVAGASLAGLAIWVGVKTHAKWLPTLSMQIRDGVLNMWWLTAFVPLGVIFGIFFGCDMWLWAFGRAKPLSVASLTRGFEPFEVLFGQLRELQGQLVLVALMIVAPLMVLVIPGIAFGALYSVMHKPLLVSLSLAIPAGVAVFLVLGFFGDLLKGSRAAFLSVSAAAVGFVLCFSYYPALANQLSPKEVFESYQKTKKDGEPLALFGVGGRTAAYYAGGQPLQLHDAPSAYQWLMGGGDQGNGTGQRRYLAMKADELPKLNALYREKSSPRINLPILDARSSQILLVASTVDGSKENQNPLNKVLLSAPPKPQHKLDVNLEDKLLVLGYDVTDNNGKWVDVVAPGRAYRMRTYYKVLAPVTTEWEAFIHIDGYHRRHNGDHKPLDGKYPFSLWLKDDLLVDDYEFKLEPNFSPGSYVMYFGLFVGDTRLKVKSGPSDGENRINGGTLHVQ